MTDHEKPPEGADEKALTEWADRRAATKRIQEQHDLLWWSLGWLPTTLKNRTALAAAIGLGLFVGGQELIGNIVKFLQGMIP